MKHFTELLSLLLIFSMFSCVSSPEKLHPDIVGHNIGIVRSTDWQDRTVVIEEDKTHIVFVLKSCSGSMPFWIGEHLEIKYRQQWSDWEYPSCQNFDYVKRIVTDQP